MAVECYHDGSETQLVATLLHEIQHLAMSPMDTVEGTGGDYFPVFLHLMLIFHKILGKVNKFYYFCVYV